MITTELILFIISPIIILLLIAILMVLTGESRKTTKSKELLSESIGYSWTEITIMREPEQTPSQLGEGTIKNIIYLN
jgi:small neutral amino acid transporter SnatA (MarC family)